MLNTPSPLSLRQLAERLIVEVLDYGPAVTPEDQIHRADVVIAVLREAGLTQDVLDACRRRGATG